MKKLFYILIIIILSTSCHKPEPEEQFHTTPYNFTIPPFFPTKTNIPQDNPLTIEGVKLGRYLFYDTRLRGYLGTNQDSMMSCASCHLQKNAFVCGIDHPKYINGKTFGITGIPTNHNMMPLFNLIFNNNGYLWNGFVNQSNISYQNLEDIVRMAITAEDEMCSTEERCTQAIASIAIYPPMFKAAFGTEEVTMDRICKAIAQFLRTLVSANSKFDKYIRGELQLSDDELQGFVLFTTEEGADCFHCHGNDGNLLMTTNLFYNNGLDSVFTDNHDRFSVTRQSKDRGAYRAPSLRNIALTAPYMHDGRYNTLEEVIDFYSDSVKNTPYTHPLMHHAHQKGVQLTPKEKRQLKAFLNCLTDEDFIQNPDFSKPAELP